MNSCKLLYNAKCFNIMNTQGRSGKILTPAEGAGNSEFILVEFPLIILFFRMGIGNPLYVTFRMGSHTDHWTFRGPV